MAEHKTLEELFELAMKYRATKIKCGPLEIELDPSAFTTAEAVIDRENTTVPMPTPEEFLFLAGADFEPVTSEH